MVKVNVLGTKIKRLKTLAPWASPQGYGLRNVHLMPTQVASASVLARPVEPILPNRRKRANAVLRQGPSCALDNRTRAWVLVFPKVLAQGSRYPIPEFPASDGLGRFGNGSEANTPIGSTAPCVLRTIKSSVLHVRRMTARPSAAPLRVLWCSPVFLDPTLCC